MAGQQLVSTILSSCSAGVAAANWFEMSVAGTSLGTMRQERDELSRLAWAFAISMVLHLLIFGGYETGRKLHWWENMHWPAWLAPVKKLAESFKKKEAL